MTRLCLVGDSDIAYWPPELFPSLTPSMDTTSARPITSGHSGATLAEILPHMQNILETHGADHELIIVACAGENDIGEGISIDNSVRSLESLFDIVLGSSTEKPSHRIFFLGPKFEPWLEDDPSFKKKYSKMSRSFERACKSHSNSENICFIDCLTMFCGETAQVPGAVLAGRAKADYKYFASDLLHLSNQGYEIWKQVVEEKIRECDA